MMVVCMVEVNKVLEGFSLGCLMKGKKSRECCNEFFG